MDDFHKGLCGWSWKENKLFELALAVVDENHLKRWEVVAAMIGGQKSAGDVQEHYSGKLDHKLAVREAHTCVLIDSTESLCLSD
ncbi:hypothetical protein GLYMA_10G137200v4 [Glycine max]|uniref:Myb-like domain-containing protein n=2 Tax=Glycine subgen. Soja TaxID=1462606 RepID=K7LJ95_SOYBN|nr:hypothetical protein GYH30_027927 [Glycine max]KRH33637.1 hypothetical protein GLYMA_10G137200v4 [Glycine max]RZB87112.1 hypothetical protein D0Y65_027000 [Glycine soja]